MGEERFGWEVSKLFLHNIEVGVDAELKLTLHYNLTLDLIQANHGQPCVRNNRTKEEIRIYCMTHYS